MRRSTDERGAVAVLAAILMGLLMITGALAADLGNAWARKRDMQTQADVAAISAANWGKDAGHWPADTAARRAAITTKAAEYILKENNSAIGTSSTLVTQVVAALTDGSDANGDIEFAADGTDMRLEPPPATVQFGLATAFGYDSVDVTASATVGLFSEVPRADVVPLYIPTGCAYGAVEADTTGGLKGKGTGQGVKGKSPDFALQGDVAPTSVVRNTGPHTLTFKVNSNTALALNDAVPPVVIFQLAIGAETWKYDITGTWTDTPNGNNKVWTLTATVGPEDVTEVAGSWSYQVSANGGTQLTDVSIFTVTGTNPSTDPGAGCAGPDQGKFGQMNSPRKGLGLTARSTRLTLNMQDGLDHSLYPYLNPPSNSCESPSGQAAAQFDDDANREGNNCIKGDQGNDGPAFAEALLGPSGRLRATNGTTKPGCARSNDGAYNNDDLSCFLRNGATASQIAQPTGVTQAMLDPAIVNSPRFVWIPVVRATDRALNDYQPIVKFVPGLITSQTMTQTADQFDTANPGFHNGLECNGTSWPCNSLSRIKIFTFNPRALPDNANAPIVDYDPTVGRETVRLID